MISKTHQILCLGRIQRPKGLKGLVRVTSFGELLENFNNHFQAVKLYKAKTIEDGFLRNAKEVDSINFKFNSRNAEVVIGNIEGITAPEPIEKYKGLYLGVEFDEIQKLFPPSKQVYLFHYLDLTTIDANSKNIVGKIIRIENQANADYLAIQTKENDEIMFPLQDELVSKIDFVDKNEIFLHNLDEYVQAYAEN